MNPKQSKHLDEKNSITSKTVSSFASISFTDIESEICRKGIFQIFVAVVRI